MIFKDLYKSANGNISGDKSLIDAIYKKAEEKPIFNFKYATLCAASLILVVSLGVFPAIKKQSAKPNVQIAKKSPDSITKVKEEMNDNKETDTNTVSTPEEDSTKKKNTNICDGYRHEAKDDVNIISQETDVSMATLDDAQMEHDKIGRNTEIISNGGGSLAIAKATAQDDNLPNVQMTTQRYLEYLGIENLDFKSSLPDGMNFDMPEHVSVILNSQTNVIEDDLIQFVAVDSQNAQRVLTLSTSTKKQDDFLYDVITDTNGINVKKHYGGNSINLYFEYNSACITIQSYGVSEEDLDMFLNSFLK